MFSQADQLSNATKASIDHQLAAMSDRPANAKGVTLTPLQRTIEALDAVGLPHAGIGADLGAARSPAFADTAVQDVVERAAQRLGPGPRDRAALSGSADPPVPADLLDAVVELDRVPVGIVDVDVPVAARHVTTDALDRNLLLLEVRVGVENLFQASALPGDLVDIEPGVCAVVGVACMHGCLRK